VDTRTVVPSRLRPGNVHAHSPNSGLSADRPAGGDEEPFDHLVGWDHLPAASASNLTAHLIWPAEGHSTVDGPRDRARHVP